MRDVLKDEVLTDVLKEFASLFEKLPGSSVYLLLEKLSTKKHGALQEYLVERRGSFKLLDKKIDSLFEKSVEKVREDYALMIDHYESERSTPRRYGHAHGEMYGRWRGPTEQDKKEYGVSIREYKRKISFLDDVKPYKEFP